MEEHVGRRWSVPQHHPQHVCVFTGTFKYIVTTGVGPISCGMARDFLSPDTIASRAEDFTVRLHLQLDLILMLTSVSRAVEG